MIGTPSANGTGRKAALERGEAKPTVLPVHPDSISAELKDRPQWVCWKCERRKGKWTKIPYNPHNGEKAKAGEPTTWGSFETALALYRAGGFDGIGYEFDAGDPYAGVDLDNCRNPDTDIIEPWAVELLDMLAGYAEVSPSGTGVKVWVRGGKPGTRCKIAHASGEVEMYDQGRYFAVTGHALPGSAQQIPERQEQLSAVYQRVFGAQSSQEEAEKPPNGKRHKTVFHMRAKSELWSKPYDQLTDDDLVQIAGEAKNSDKFRKLWDGDASGYDNDQSRADSALCCILAYWCRKDAARSDRLFRQSKLMRPKWDEVHRGDGATYGKMTIEGALAVCKDVYPGPQPNTPNVEEWLASAGPSTPPEQAAPNPDQKDGPKPPHCVILEYFHRCYRPVFRRGNVLYSDTLQREVKPGEACFAAPFAVLVQLAEATGAPRDRQGHLDVNALPSFFRTWAPVAWRDLLDALPDEENTGEISAPAMEEFRAKLAGALLTFVALAYTHRGGEGDQVGPERSEVQRRPLLEWARLFAKAGSWRDVRNYRIWSRLDVEQNRLRVALRCELFHQLHVFDLAKMSQKHFTEACRLYGLGTPVRVRGGNCRAVELTPEFLADLLATPEGDETQPGQTDEQEADTRGHTRETHPQASGGDVNP
jgi:putative DNA primase/helicase